MAIRSYNLTCIQSSIEVIDDPRDKDAVIGRNLDRSLRIAESIIRRDAPKVIVFPEGWLQGNNHLRSAEDWSAICIQVPGLETARLGEFARRHQIYLAGAVFEKDLDWPEVWFTTGFVIDPAGKVALRYRKLQERNAEGRIPNTSPANVYSAYVGRYGEDSLFPVLDTPYGRLAVLVENDINFFELTRVFVFRGAEIFLHPTAEENGSEFPAWDQARRSRGYESLAYIASANGGEIRSACYPSQASRGCSTVVEFQGNIAARIDGPGESFLTTRIDLQRLRRRRTEGRMNYPAQVKSQLFGKEFGKVVLMPLDTGPATAETGQRAIARLTEEGVIVAP